MIARLTVAAAVFVAVASGLSAQEIVARDAYARILPGAKAGAVYMTIENTGTAADRLLSARTGIAGMAEFHTNRQTADGMMQMLPIEGGIALAAGASHVLESGGDHLMLMVLTAAPAEGQSFPVTLNFEAAGEITVDVVVDNRR